MEITKIQQLVAKFASPSEIRQELACVQVDGRKAVATDSFRLMEIERKDEAAPKASKKPWLVFAKELLKAKHSPKSTNIGVIEGDGSSGTGAIKTDIASFPVRIHTYHNDTYPKYEIIMNEAEKEECTEIRLDAEYLAEIAGVLAKIGDGHVKLRVPHKHGRPVLFDIEDKNHKARALLMPLNR